MGLNPMYVAGFALFSVGIFSGCYLFTTDFTHRLVSTPGAFKSLGYVCILGAFGTAIAQSLFNKMMKISSPIYSASVTYTIPVVAILWGLFDNEKIGLIQLIGFAIVLAGLFLVNKRESINGTKL